MEERQRYRLKELKENDREIEETYLCGNDFGAGDFGRTDAGSRYEGAKSIAQCTFFFLEG